MLDGAINTYNIAPYVPLFPSRDDAKASADDVNLPANVVLPRGQMLSQVAANANQVNTATFGGTAATGGTFALLFSLDGVVQAVLGIAYNASLASIQASVRSLPLNSIGTVTLTGTKDGLATGTIIASYSGNLGNRPIPLFTVDPTLLTGGAPTATSAVTTPGATAGTFVALAGGTAKRILQFPCATDGSGNITYGPVSGAQHGTIRKSTPAFYAGVFNCADLTGLTTQAILDMGGRLISGTVSVGEVYFP